MRRLAAFLLGGLLSIGTAQALQLGEIQLDASSSQPVTARIALLHADAAELDGAQVTLAEAKRHVQAGINPARVPDAMRIQLVDEPDRAAIKVSLPEALPADQQVFDFIVEIDWAGGQLARAYGFERREGQLQAVSRGDAQFGPTQRSDTLYSIANALRPPAVATNQMMLALLAENPNRFNAPNVNALQRDVLLRLPQPQALRFPSEAAADREVSRQIAAWGQGAAAENGTVEAPKVVNETELAEPQAPALRLLPPDETAAAEPEPGFGAAEFAALAEQLTRVEQANEQLVAQNAELQRAVEALQADITRLEDLLATPPSSSATEIAEPRAQSEQPITAEAVADWVREEVAAVVADPGLALQRPWSRGVMIGLAVFVALMLLAWLLGRRRPVAQKAQDDALPERWRPQTGRVERTDSLDEAELGSTTVRQTEASSGDPLDRASELIAYGQLAQAQAVLDDALGETPDSVGLRLRLLEVLAMRGDRAGFESEAHVLHAQINDDDDPRWQRVARQGRELSPDHPLFAAAE